MEKGSNIILWCDGLKKKTISEIFSDSSEDNIQDTVKKKRKRAKKVHEEDGEIKKRRKKGEDRDKEV